MFQDLVSIEQKKSDWTKQYFLKSNSTNSENNAIKTLKIFRGFLNEKHPGMSEDSAINSMLAASNDPLKYTQVYLFLNQFVQYMVVSQYAPRSTRLYFAYFKDFCRYNGIRIYNEDVKQFVKLPKVLKEKKRPLLYNMINVLLSHCGKLYKAYILFLLSSGMRMSEGANLLVSDLDTSKFPIKVNVRAEIAKMRVERTTFISREAYEALVPILKDRKPDDLIFFPNRNSKIESVIETTFNRIRKRAKLLDKTGTGLYQVRLHRFRDFFITQTDKIHEGLGHALAGHDKYMNEYETFTDDELREFYLKAEPSLTIQTNIS